MDKVENNSQAWGDEFRELLDSGLMHDDRPRMLRQLRKRRRHAFVERLRAQAAADHEKP